MNTKTKDDNKKYKEGKKKYSTKDGAHYPSAPDKDGHTEDGGRGKFFPNEDKRGAESE